MANKPDRCHGEKEKESLTLGHRQTSMLFYLWESNPELLTCLERSGTSQCALTAWLPQANLLSMIVLLLMPEGLIDASAPLMR